MIYSSLTEQNSVRDVFVFSDRTAENIGKGRTKTMTNENGRFGIHGGQYVPEILMNAVNELEQAIASRTEP